jgi:hypothetical protein
MSGVVTRYEDVRLREDEIDRLRGAFDDGGSVAWMALHRAVERIVSIRLTEMADEFDAIVTGREEERP